MVTFKLEVLLMLLVLADGALGANFFPSSIQTPFIKYLNGMRFLVGASDMRMMSWDEKLEIKSQSSANDCSLENKYYMGYAKMPMDLAIYNVTIDEVAYPDLSLALVTWWRGQKTFQNLTCPDDDDMCMYSAHMNNADTEKIGCTYNFCKSFKDTKTEYSFSNGVIVICKFDWNGYYPGERRHTVGRKCDLCSNNCVDDLLCGTPDPSYGYRGYRG